MLFSGYSGYFVVSENRDLWGGFVVLLFKCSGGAKFTSYGVVFLWRWVPRLARERYASGLSSLTGTFVTMTTGKVVPRTGSRTAGGVFFFVAVCGIFALRWCGVGGGEGGDGVSRRPVMSTVPPVDVVGGTVVQLW